MPGKVNPVIPEAVNQVAFQIIGNDLALTIAAEGAGADEILMDIRYLRRLWDQIGAQIKSKLRQERPMPGLLSTLINIPAEWKYPAHVRLPEYA